MAINGVRDESWCGRIGCYILEAQPDCKDTSQGRQLDRTVAVGVWYRMPG
jgi:hypothetical protein